MSDTDQNGANAGSGAEVIGALRNRPANVLLLWGFGPAVVAVALLVMMLWLAPSVAPEHIVDKPLHPTTTFAPR